MFLHSKFTTRHYYITSFIQYRKLLNSDLCSLETGILSTLLCDVNYSCENLTWLTDLINVFFRLKWQVGIIDFIELKVESCVLLFVVKVSKRGIKTTLSLMYIQWLNSLLLWSIQKNTTGLFFCTLCKYNVYVKYVHGIGGLKL